MYGAFSLLPEPREAYPPGPVTVSSFLLDSFPPETVQMAPRALQSVVLGSTMTTSPFRSGVTVISRRMFGVALP